MPSRAAAASVSTGSDRTTSTGERAPSRCSAARAERAVAPPPSTTGDEQRLDAGLRERRDDAVDVGVVAAPPAVPQHDGVGGRHVAGEVGDLSSSGSTACLSGMVSDRPAHSGPRPGEEGRQLVLADLDGVVRPVQAERGVRRAVQRGDSECAIGRPSTAARPGTLEDALGARLVALAQEGVVVVR